MARRLRHLRDTEAAHARFPNVCTYFAWLSTHLNLSPHRYTYRLFPSELIGNRRMKVFSNSATRHFHNFRCEFARSAKVVRTTLIRDLKWVVQTVSHDCVNSTYIQISPPWSWTGLVNSDDHQNRTADCTPAVIYRIEVLHNFYLSISECDYNHDDKK